IVKFVINGKTFYLIEQEIQVYWDKEEEIKKDEEEARLNAISKTETSSIKSMITKMYNAFRGQSSLAPPSSVTLTFAITVRPANVEGENATHITTKEPPSHTEGEIDAHI
nr:hypothetical protein [Tanacetum cinerariifolium]